MSELSNLLRQRLGAQNKAEVEAAGVHPDADTLTAYSEQLLPAAERQHVLRHLAACGECREVVALSQSEVPEAVLQPVLTPSPVPVWRRLLSPAFGVAGLVAAMAVIALLVVQTPHKSDQQQAGELKVAPPPASAPVVPAEPAGSASAQPAARGAMNLASRDRDRSAASVAGLAALSKPAKIANKIASATDRFTPSSQPVRTAGKQDFVNNAFFDANVAESMIAGPGSYDYPAAPQPHGTASEARFNLSAGGQITGFSDIPANATNNKSSVAVLTPPPPPEHFGLRLDKMMVKGARAVFRAPTGAPAIRANSLGASAMSLAPKFTGSTKAEPGAVAAAPAKSESAGFAGSGAFSYASRPAISSAETTAATWKVTDGKLLKAYGQAPWQEAATPAVFEFTTVSAHGGEVWAGGANAGLIHSYDGGNTWTLVKLGEEASGAIVSILFSGNQVQVKTSDDQSWSSANGGKSWVKN
jgi:photosynthesis system II assembly factor YCF48-like protein